MKSEIAIRFNLLLMPRRGTDRFADPALPSRTEFVGPRRDASAMRNSSADERQKFEIDAPDIRIQDSSSCIAVTTLKNKTHFHRQSN
jgi:hypothetical protein